MVSSRAIVGVVLFVALSATAVPVGAVDQVNGSPDVSLQTPVREFAPGQEVSLPIYVSNAGSIQESGPAEYVERVTTARALTLDVRSGESPIEVTTGRYPVGNVPEGTVGPYEVSLTIPENATPGTYRLPVRVGYSYTPSVRYGSGTDGPEFRTVETQRTRYVEIRVRDQPRFEIVDIDSNVSPGGYGTVGLTIQNVGTDAARDASLGVRSADEEFAFGAGTEPSRAFSEAWRPGENRTFEFRARVGSDAVVRQYPITATVTYADDRGISRQSRAMTSGVEPLPEPIFALEDLSSSWYVGEPGTVSGTIRNVGPTAVDSAFLVFETSNPNVAPVDSEVALGTLAPGEEREFTFEADIGQRARAGRERLNLTVRYRDQAGNRRASDSIEPSVSIATEREWLEVRPENATFEIDSENRLTLRVRNVENVTLSDVRARLDTEEPFTSASRTAYRSELAPGEPETLAFEITVSEDAVATQSSVAVNITGERPDGERITIDTYVVPVTVVDDTAADNTTILGGAALLVVLALIGGWWWLNKR